MTYDTDSDGRATERRAMARPRYQDGTLVIRGKRRKQYLIRWREDTMGPDGTVVRKHRAETLGPISQIKRQQALEVLQSRVNAASQARTSPNAFVPFSEFVSAEWKPNASLALKKSSMRIYCKRPVLTVFEKPD
jgi:hypothetical protein